MVLIYKFTFHLSIILGLVLGALNGQLHTIAREVNRLLPGVLQTEQAFHHHRAPSHAIMTTQLLTHHGIQSATTLMSCSHHLGLGTHDTLELLWESLDCGSCHKCENRNSKGETKVDEGIVESVTVTKPYEEMEKITKKLWTYTGLKTGKVSNLEVLCWDHVCKCVCLCVYIFFTEFKCLQVGFGLTKCHRLTIILNEDGLLIPAIEHSGTGSKTGYWQIHFCSYKFSFKIFIPHGLNSIY